MQPREAGDLAAATPFDCRSHTFCDLTLANPSRIVLRDYAKRIHGGGLRSTVPPLLEKRESLSLLVDGLLVKDLAVHSGERLVTCYPCTYARRYWHLLPLLYEALTSTKACYLVVELPRSRRVHLVVVALEGGRAAVFFASSRMDVGEACRYSREVLERLGGYGVGSEGVPTDERSLQLLRTLVRVFQAKRVAACSCSDECVEVRGGRGDGPGVETP